MVLNTLALKLKRQARGDVWGRHFEATLIVQAVSWYLRYALSYRDIEEMLLERGLTIDHSTINRWVLASAPAIERRLRQSRKPHCGSVRVDETYIKVLGPVALPLPGHRQAWRGDRLPAHCQPRPRRSQALLPQDATVSAAARP
jgi:hypothetical protein